MDRHWRALRLVVIAGDGLAVTAALAASALLRFPSGGNGGLARLPTVYPLLIGAVVVLMVSVGWISGIYRHWALMGGHRVYPKLVVVSTFGLVAIISLSYFLGGPPVVSRAWLLLSWLGSITLLSVSRIVLRQLALQWQRQGYLVRNVLIAGANQHGIAVAQQLSRPAVHGRRVVGFLDDYQRPGTEVLPGLPVVGNPSSLLELAEDLAVEEVIIIAGGLTWESQREMAEMVTSPSFPLDARLSPTFYDLLTTSAELSHIAYVPMLTLSRARLSGLNAAAKRALDLAVSSLLLVALTPLWLYWRVVAWVRGVPMLERESVLGFGGEQFDVVSLNPALARSPVADRLPTLWNVLCGDLSLVGPRPVRTRELDGHERWTGNLFAMRPGLTGIWRLRSKGLALEERVALDLYYVRNYTLSLDGQILLNTGRYLFHQMLSGEPMLARWDRLPPSGTAPGAAPPAWAPAAASMDGAVPRAAPAESRGGVSGSRA